MSDTSLTNSEVGGSSLLPWLGCFSCLLGRLLPRYGPVVRGLRLLGWRSLVEASLAERGTETPGTLTFNFNEPIHKKNWAIVCITARSDLCHCRVCVIPSLLQNKFKLSPPWHSCAAVIKITVAVTQTIVAAAQFLQQNTLENFIFNNFNSYAFVCTT